MLWYNELAARVQKDIESLDWTSLLGDRPFEVTSRPKTIDTLREKLLRNHSTTLGSIQDIAGVRFEAEMTLDEQDAVVNAIVGRFSHDLDRNVRDLRTDPHSGYRAVHVRLKLDAPVEVQVRTHLQGHWANMYESAADVLGRDIRYDGRTTLEGGDAIVSNLKEISTVRIAQMESDSNEVAQLLLSITELEDKYKARREMLGTIWDSIQENKTRVKRLQIRGKNNERKLQREIANWSDLFASMREQEGAQ